MALTNGEFSAADLAAVVGNNDGMNGSNSFAWWLLILLLFANNGWGSGWNNGNGNVGSTMPQVATTNDVNNGFAQMSVMNGLSDITAAISNGFSNSEISRTNMLSNLTNQMNASAMAQQQCCCNTQAAIKDVQYTVAQEACADRSAVSDALRDVIAANNASTQRILDQMCSDKIDAKNEQIAALQQQLTMAQLAASQNAQTAAILANNEAQTAALEQYLSPVPRPAYVVQNPNCCGNYYTSACGCGMNA